MLEDNQVSFDSSSAKARDTSLNSMQLVTWSASDRVPYNTDQNSIAGRFTPDYDVQSDRQLANYDAANVLLKNNGRLFDTLDVADAGGKHDGRICQNDLQVFLGDQDSTRHLSRRQLDAVQYLLDNWDNDSVKGLKTENSLFMNGYLTRDSLARGLGYDSRETMALSQEQSAVRTGHVAEHRQAAGDAIQNDVNMKTARQLLRNNGELFDALDVAAHGGRQDGRFNQNDVSNFLANPINVKHFTPEQMQAAQYLNDNWDYSATKGLKTDNSLFMTGYITRDSLAKGLGFDSRENMTRSFAHSSDPMAGKFYPSLEIHNPSPGDNGTNLHVFQRDETIYDVARRALVERSHKTGEAVDRDSIFRECNRIMVNSGFPAANLEGKNHITQRDLPRAWNSIRHRQVLTIYTPGTSS